jgi:hypothetical protein
MPSSDKKPSLIDQAVAAVPSDDGVTAAVLVKDGSVGAEVTARKDIGKKGGWTLAAVARTNDRFAAIVAKWTGKS